MYTASHNQSGNIMDVGEMWDKYGVRLSPLGTSGANWPIVPAPEDKWWMWSSWWNENWQGKPKYSEKTCPSAILSTTNPTWPDLSWNPGHRCGKPATNRLSYVTATILSKTRCEEVSQHSRQLLVAWSVLWRALWTFGFHEKRAVSCSAE
jgi:hypothetical protein